MPGPRTKGAHVLSAVKVLRGNRERALSLLPPTLHHYLDERILPSSWYPLEEHLGLLHAVAKLWPEAGDAAWIMMGRGTAQMDLHGIYKHFLVAGDPARTLTAMRAVWQSAHDTGEVTMTSDAPGRARVELRNFGIRSQDFCRVTTGYILEVISLAGGRDGAVDHERCRNRGASECVWRATWS